MSVSGQLLVILGMVTNPFMLLSLLLIGFAVAKKKDVVTSLIASKKKLFGVLLTGLLVTSVVLSVSGVVLIADQVGVGGGEEQAQPPTNATVNGVNIFFNQDYLFDGELTTETYVNYSLTTTTTRVNNTLLSGISYPYTYTYNNTEHGTNYNNLTVFYYAVQYPNENHTTTIYGATVITGIFWLYKVADYNFTVTNAGNLVETFIVNHTIVPENVTYVEQQNMDMTLTNFTQTTFDVYNEGTHVSRDLYNSTTGLIREGPRLFVPVEDLVVEGQPVANMTGLVDDDFITEINHTTTFQYNANDSNDMYATYTHSYLDSGRDMLFPRDMEVEVYVSLSYDLETGFLVHMEMGMKAKIGLSEQYNAFAKYVYNITSAYVLVNGTAISIIPYYYYPLNVTIDDINYYSFASTNADEQASDKDYWDVFSAIAIVIYSYAVSVVALIVLAYRVYNKPELLPFNILKEKNVKPKKPSLNSVKLGVTDGNCDPETGVCEI